MQYLDVINSFVFERVYQQVLKFLFQYPIFGKTFLKRDNMLSVIKDALILLNNYDSDIELLLLVFIIFILYRADITIKYPRDTRKD